MLTLHIYIYMHYNNYSRIKYEFLSKAPGIGNASLKSHDKYKNYSDKVAKSRQ